ncbi:hypothetical protein [Desulfomarina sp.]
MKAMIGSICFLGCLLFFATGSFAASAKCQIVQIEGTKMVLDCPKGIERFQEKGTIKIKSLKKKKIEGC